MYSDLIEVLWTEFEVAPSMKSANLGELAIVMT